MGNLISVDEVKTILQISGSSNDDFIVLMIPVVEDFTLKFCNLTLTAAAEFPALKLPLSQMINYQLGKPSNVTSEKIGDYSVTFGSTTYPGHIISGLRPFRCATFVTGSESYEGYPADTWNTFSEASNT